MPKLKRLSHSALKDAVTSRRQHVVASKREQNGLSVHAKELGLPIATVKVKDGQYDVLPRFISSCCYSSIWWNAKLKQYICLKCGEPCKEV